MIGLVLLAPALLCLCGVLALVFGRARRACEAFGAWGACAASLLGLGITIFQLLSKSAFGAARGVEGTLTLSWNGTIGASFSVGLDPLTGLFLLSIYGLGAACAAFGAGYMRHYGDHRSLGPSWLFYCLLVASMALVVLSRNAVLFLFAWELMSISSYFLVTFEREKEGVAEAGITYLVASQIGTAFLLVLFLLLGASGQAALPGTPASAGLDFSRFGGLTGSAAGAVFLLALVGFGTKAGIVPLHVWLPEAHPAAPSHVSALMSGVMIKTGIYGIVRVLGFLGAPAPWWGWTLLALGACSAVFGVLFALAQRDIKRLLAYSSVENIGIICLGLGIGVLGASHGLPVVAALGFAGGLLHVVNHALFKGLLFLGAGAAAQAAGTRDLDRLGGLAKRMPVTAAAFLIGALAICGLPPLNGFVSELLVYGGAAVAVTATGVPPAAAGAVAIVSLALVSGLAAACFTKVLGIAFLGEARTGEAAAAREAPASMLAPMLAIAVAIAGIGLLGPVALSFIAPLARRLAGIPTEASPSLFVPVADALGNLLPAAGLLAGLVAALALLRFLLLRRKSSQAPTWGCGYVAPTARMQYTSTSFAQPLLAVFRGIVAPRRMGAGPGGLFPSAARFSTAAPDPFEHGAYRPLFRGIGWLLSRLRLLQRGRLQLYVLYVAATLLILLVWKLG